MKEFPVCEDCALTGVVDFYTWRQGVLSVTASETYDRTHSRHADFYGKVEWNPRTREYEKADHIISFVIPPAKPVPPCLFCRERKSKYRTMKLSDRHDMVHEDADLLAV